MYKFSQIIEIIGVNPYVLIPQDILSKLKADSKKTGPIQVIGMLSGAKFEANIVKYSGLWRLYLNTGMRKNSKTKVGDSVIVQLKFDSKTRITPIPPLFQKSLDKNPNAKIAFNKLSASRQKEILRYLGNLKTLETLNKNINKTIAALSNKRAEKPIYMRS